MRYAPRLTVRPAHIAAVAAVLTLAFQAAPALPVFSAATGNTYDHISGTFTWAAAKTDAESKGGHLATVTSLAEDDFLKAQFAAQIGVVLGPWLGASHDGPAPSGPITGWAWVTGESFALYQGWNSGEPSGDFGTIRKGGLHFSTGGGGWNDIPIDANNTGGYLIEFEAPEPAALTLLGLGLAGIGFAGRRRH